MPAGVTISGRGVGSVAANYIDTHTTESIGTDATTLNTYTVGAGVLGRDGDSLHIEYSGSVIPAALIGFSVGGNVTTLDAIPSAKGGSFVLTARIIRTGSASQTIYFSLVTGSYSQCAVDTSLTLSTDSTIAVVFLGTGVSGTGDVTLNSTHVTLWSAPR